jgi:hypothetical protein
LAISLLFAKQTVDVSNLNEDVHSIVSYLQQARQAQKDFVITTDQGFVDVADEIRRFKTS